MKTKLCTYRGVDIFVCDTSFSFMPLNDDTFDKLRDMQRTEVITHPVFAESFIEALDAKYPTLRQNTLLIC